jgi:hypothetical protein
VPVAEDCHVAAQYPDANYNGQILPAGVYLVSWQKLWTYLKFNLDGICDVVSAKLYLYCTQDRYPFRPTIACNGHLNSGWSESTLTWNTRPAGDGTQLTQSIAIKNTWQVWDVTSWAQNHENSTVTFILHGIAGQLRRADYASKEYTDPALMPYLEVWGNYEIVPIEPFTQEDESICPKFILYDPLGVESYQKLETKTELQCKTHFQFESEGSCLIAFKTGFDLWLSETIRLTDTYYSSPIPDAEHNGFGGDTLVADIFKTKTRISGYYRAGAYWHSWKIDVELLEHSTKPGVFQWARVDLDAETAALIPDMREQVGPVHYPIDLGPGQFERSLEKELGIGFKWYLGFGVNYEASVGIFYAQKIKFKVMFTFTVELETSLAIASTLYLKDFENPMQFECNEPTGYSIPGWLHLHPQEYVFWFNY